MRTFKLIFAITLSIVLYSCSSVRVNSDFDKNVDYSKYKTYAFYADGIDKVEISDLDKKRILKAIDTEMQNKGFTKSENPDLLINIHTKATENVYINNYGYGWGWTPFYYRGNYSNVSKSVEGTLYIDLIDGKKRELVWQGIGEGALTKNANKKDEVYYNFVQRILNQFPPNKK